MQNLDVYYSAEYLELSAPLEPGSPELFEHVSELGRIQYRFVKRAIPTSADENLWDITTPYGYGGPIVLECASARDLPALVYEFGEAFHQYCLSQQIVSEFVRFNPVDNMALIFGSLYSLELNRKTVITDLSGDEVLSRELGKKVRWRARKNISLGVSVSLKQPESLDRFKALYDETMLKNQAREFYFFDQSYFVTILELMRTRVLLAEATFEGQHIASGLFLLGSRVIHYHLSGSNPEYSELSPTTSLLSEVIKWGSTNDYDFLHLGGGRSASADDSLFRFKSKFGTRRGNFYIGKRIHDPERYFALSKGLKDDATGFFPAYRT